MTGGDGQTNLPIFSELAVVGHTYAVDGRAGYFHGGYWYVEPDWT